MSDARQRDEVEPPLVLTVAAVARRLGVAPATLRTWDRRYGLGPSEHAPGSHRRYRPADVRRLGAMRDLTLQGMPPGDAARAVLTDSAASGNPVGAAGALDSISPVDATFPADAAPAPGVQRVAASSLAASSLAGSSLAGSSLPASPSAAPAPTPATPARTGRRRGGGNSLALPGADDRVRGLATAAMALDQAAVLASLRTALRTNGAAGVWLDLLRPVLVGIGQRWEATGHGVEVEHLLSAAALTVFAEAVVTPLRDRDRRARPVLLGAAPEEMHDLPLHALAATLAERGVATRMLGARVPADALAAAVRRTGACAVVVYALMPSCAEPAVLEDIPVTRPAVSIFAAGGGWSGAPLPKRVTSVDDLHVARRLVAAAAGRAPAT